MPVVVSLATGDGGLANDPCGFAQDGNVFFGKVLRLDVDNIPANKTYGIPPDNPFVNNSKVRGSLRVEVLTICSIFH